MTRTNKKDTSGANWKRFTACEWFLGGGVWRQTWQESEFLMAWIHSVWLFVVVLSFTSKASHNELKCRGLMCNSHLPISVPQRTNKGAWMQTRTHRRTNVRVRTHTHRLLVWIAFILRSCKREAEGRNRILLSESYWIKCHERVGFFSSCGHQKTLHPATHMWSSAGIQAQCYTPFLQNNNNKPKSNLTTETTPIGVTNVQGPSPASFPTVLFIIFPLSGLFSSATAATAASSSPFGRK